MDIRAKFRPDLADPLTVALPDFSALQDSKSHHPFPRVTRIQQDILCRPQGSGDLLDGRVKGRARKEIPALAKSLQADLVVMGTVARTGIPGFFSGNTAESILGQIKCSVLAIKPPGFKTPVTVV